MEIMTLTLAMLFCLQLKHFIADYLLQPGWMLGGKGDLRRVGGYVHAGLHALGSLPALLIAGLEPTAIVLLCAAEFTVHYATDYTKAGLSGRSHAGPDTRTYWAMHGADQFLHQLTYVGLIFAALA
ncbi:DUF3307 domain-containing protein [Mesorhizobium sp.]|uniref:DUF3307 domain-containing protein n=1 Tax=Mesorhizobium sp. TaxID=1871066 RepID=UPI000FE78A55|nr:DUF3307 domain-containing protein [Mesorhizobium sp.]RWO63603.1 MAG: DUF3307 domain-containing protein [Mesorhizobium sp.]